MERRQNVPKLMRLNDFVEALLREGLDPDDIVIDYESFWVRFDRRSPGEKED
jgi:hypothetical protein